jgi:hypothetical protein
VIARLPLASWRLVVATCALVGVGFAARDLDLWWQGLSQQACVATAVVFYALAVTGLVRPTAHWAWVRGALATTLVLVAGGYGVLMGGGLGEPWSLLEHVVTPLLVVADVVLVSRASGPWWWPLTWPALPVAYLVYYVYGEVVLYDFLDPYAADYQVTVLGFLLATLAIGFALNSLVRARLSA